MTLQAYIDRFSRLVVNVSHGRASPHKICMLLAVLDLARAGGLAENRIVYAPPLLERYRRFFDAVSAPGDHPNPYFPFFHLSGKLKGGGASFWHLEPLPGREAVLASMSTARSSSEITTNVAFAKLDPGLHQLLQDPTAIDSLTAALGEQWLGRGLQDLVAVVERSALVSRYERELRAGTTPPSAREKPPPAYVRNPAFRRVVTQVYDYRCAATGVRILLPSGEAMVEAAHIHPFGEAGDDDPRNGLALSPDMHWAMDRNLIAPGPDFRWHVSKLLDPRIPDFRTLCELDGRDLLLPGEPRMYPKRESLEWRVERLRDTEWIAPEATPQ
jgi:putative restriction endonuclease